MRQKGRKQRKMQNDEKALYVLLLLLIIAYAFTKNYIFSIAFVVVFAALLIVETKRDIKVLGLRATAVEVLETLGVIFAVWIVAILLLGTSSPLDVVPSCSMLPTLRIGDVVVLKHISNMTSFLISNHIPIVNVSPQAYYSMLANISNEFLAFYAYFGNNKSNISYIVEPGEKYGIGLYNTKCLSIYAYENEHYNFARCFVENASQQRNLIKYSYTIGNVLINNTRYQIVYTNSVKIANTTVTDNYTEPIIVYSTIPQDTFSGNIVHRLVAAIKVGNQYYLLTKGDNNQAFDIQFGNYPPNGNEVLGYIIAKIPWIGYITLAFKGGIDTAGCNQIIIHTP
ncbi:MAG: hypothetical protein ACP5GD_03660 [Candidatus Micrarchaeia archaeon]